MKLNNLPKYKIDAKEGEHNYSIAHNACGVADLIQEEEPFINKPVWRERDNRVNSSRCESHQEMSGSYFNPKIKKSNKCKIFYLLSFTSYYFKPV